MAMHSATCTDLRNNLIAHLASILLCSILAVAGALAYSLCG
jgi:hypothetical protein